jgi:hypothetical protein
LPTPEPGPVAVVRPAAPAPAPAAATGWPLLLILAIPSLVTAWGLPYYLASTAERLRHPLNGLLKSSGPIGLAFGVAALAMFVFMWLYPFRKSAKWLAWTGPVGRWLDVHIVMGLALPPLAAVHAGWHFDGLIGMGMLAMVIVSLSGVVGRYLYTHLPRSRSGLELSQEEAGAERRALLTNLSVATGLTPNELERDLALDPRPYENLGIARTFVRLLQDDWRRASTLRRLSREWAQARRSVPLDREELANALKLARREMALAQQLRALDATKRVFAWWHVAHRPFALSALLAVTIHVAVAIWVGGVRLDFWGVR